MPAHPDCTRCPLFQTTSRVGIDGVGRLDAKLLLVGEAPGADEEKNGIPFVGSAGKVLDRALAEVGLSREDVRITNTVRCRPPGNAKPNKEQIAACFGYLADELAEIRPSVVLALGGTSFEALTGRGGITANRGKVLEPAARVRVGDTKFLGTFHPAALLHHHGGNEYQHIVQDLRYAKVLAGIGSPELPQHEHRLLLPGYTVDELWAALDWVDADRVAIDCEWTALKDRPICWPWTRNSELLSIAIAGRVKGAIRSVALAWPPPVDGLTLLRAALPDRRAVFHNAMADLTWLGSVKLPVQLVGDTMVLAHLLDEQQPLALERLGSQAGIKPWKIEKTWEVRPTAQEDWQTLLGYNADDVYATLLIEAALAEQVKKRSSEERDGIRRMYLNLLLPAIPMFVAMAAAGVPIDGEALVTAIKATRVRQREAGSALAAEVGEIDVDTAINLANSSDQTQKLLRRSGIILESSRKDQLNDLGDTCPAAAHILAVRKEAKMAGTFLEPWQELLQEQGDARLHSVYGIVNSRTGRTSAQVEKGGSLQVMPREPWVREMVRARPGWVIIAADYSQLELRLIAWLANERNMRQIYTESREADLHKATGGYLVALSEERMTAMEYWPKRHKYMERVTGKIRQASKGMNFALCYGAEVDRFQSYTKQNYGVVLTYEEAARYRAGYFELYPDLIPWHRQGVDIANRGWCVTPFGRYRRQLEDFRKAVNTPIQAMGTDLCVLAETETYRQFKAARIPARLIGFVHDCIMAEAREDVADEAIAIITACMENPPMEPLGVTSIPVPLIAEVSVGEKWSK